MNLKILLPFRVFAERADVIRIVAETDPANVRMLRLFETRGFTLRTDIDGGVVEVVKELPRRGE